MSSVTVALDPSVRDYADTSPAKLGRREERSWGGGKSGAGEGVQGPEGVSLTAVT